MCQANYMCHTARLAPCLDVFFIYNATEAHDQSNPTLLRHLPEAIADNN